jgi:membrane associated rhomboid family serine protease
MSVAAIFALIGGILAIIFYDRRQNKKFRDNNNSE